MFGQSAMERTRKDRQNNLQCIDIDVGGAVAEKDTLACTAGERNAVTRKLSEHGGCDHGDLGPPARREPAG